LNQIEPSRNIIVLHVIDSDGNELMGDSVSLFVPPKDLLLPRDALVEIKSIEAVAAPNKRQVVEMTLLSNTLLLYVLLSCGVEGHFEENAFIMKAGIEKVSLLHS